MKKKYIPLIALSSIAVIAASSIVANNTSYELFAVGKEDYAVYTITMNPCNGSTANIFTRTGSTGDSIRLTTPAYTKHSFLGWSTDYDPSTKMGTTADIISGTTFTVGTDNQVLYGVWQSVASHTEEEVDAYMATLAETSVAGHVYYHYYRYDNTAESYADWDIWAWPYRPTEGEGVKFDWYGRTQSEDHLTATGDAVVDDFGGAYIDIDLSATYDGNWNNRTEVIGGTDVSFTDCTYIGFQIVQSATRTTGSGFWTNDGGDHFVKLENYAMEVDGGTAYHIFALQDNVQSFSNRPITDTTSPFDDDDGYNVTYGDDTYETADFSTNADIQATATDWSDGVGAGYQVMVSSFADSDGDGFGDIYGIEQKLDYIANLGVKALWLTPIQLSDSYHGYDISDYTQVDPKYGSSVSPAAIANGGEVTSATAMEDYKSLITSAHAKGIKVVMDLVLNHTSTSNKWFISSANLAENYRGFYQWGNHELQTHITQDNCWYPYGDHPYSYYAKFGTSMPELNYSYQDTREAVEDMSLTWCSIGVDGFRLDAVKHIYMLDEISSYSGDTVIYDDSDAGDYSSDLTKNLNFFRELNATVKAQYPNCFFVGENFDGHAYHVAPYYEAFDSMFDFYSYFNLTSAAATGRTGTTSAYGTAQAFMTNTGTYTTSSDSSANDAGGILSRVNGSAWNFPAVYNSYTTYRGDTALPGLFTSNHDIARVINRVAGTGTGAGIEEQGTVTAGTYASMEQSANCVKIAEILFPGCTWIYYGDELGMTGNFPEGKDSDSDYADLWYRQPMKWVQDGAKGDGSYTCDYYVTGSSAKVESDSINASELVAPATTQVDDASSEYNILKKFITLKTDTYAKLLTSGSIAAGNFASGALAANVLSFTRSLGSETLKIAINFNSTSISATGLGNTVIATYNNDGNSITTLPAYSVTVTK